MESFQYTSLPSNGIINVQRGGTLAVAPNAIGYTIPFIEAQTEFSSVAIANTTTSPVSVAMTVRNYVGTTLGTYTISLPPRQQTAFLLSQYPVTSGKAGTIAFETPSAGQIAVLGLDFNKVNDAFTSVLALPLTVATGD
jgi:hypothetical protein